MPATPALELSQSCSDMAKAAKAASYQLASLDASVKNSWLTQSAEALLASTDLILEANERDISAAEDHGLSAASVDRLRLDPERIASIAAGLREIAMLPDPVGEVMDGFTRPGGLQIQKKRVPLGVVFFIYSNFV